jgi:hypothetical protein
VDALELVDKILERLVLFLVVSWAEVGDGCVGDLVASRSREIGPSRWVVAASMESSDM